MRPFVYRNIAKQLNISVAVEAVVSDAFLSVATEILVMGKWSGRYFKMCFIGSVCGHDLTVPALKFKRINKMNE